ncbi:hypothetical protein [Mesorhizobium sp. M1E.F.Ca.ET.041.01.1.1]|uniref:hypothetical protein n=1 Tax=Mesorhizobium sp. M1E.F.Ca.ET.041.01.1.1 TaxID=2496759 RepID=UPI00167844BB|nr:hypothetical protein [Mesorhizobium sp. M1E.F.Ca.ET.041.01.1.1]
MSFSLITEPGQALGPERAQVPVREPVQAQVQVPAQEQALQAPAQEPELQARGPAS